MQLIDLVAYSVPFQITFVDEDRNRFRTWENNVMRCTL